MNTAASLVNMVCEQAESRQQAYDQMINSYERKIRPMKISEMSTATFADFIDAAGDSICNIMQNDSVAALFNATEARNPVRWMVDAAKVLCGPCRADVFAVIGAMHGVSPDAVAHQNILVTLGQLRSIYEDLKSADVPE